MDSFCFRKSVLEQPVPLFSKFCSPKMLQLLRLTRFDASTCTFCSHEASSQPPCCFREASLCIWNKYFNLQFLLPCSLLGASLQPACSLPAAFWGVFFFQKFILELCSQLLWIFCRIVDSEVVEFLRLTRSKRVNLHCLLLCGLLGAPRQTF